MASKEGKQEDDSVKKTPSCGKDGVFIIIQLKS
jgi:hypothetical protein